MSEWGPDVTDERKRQILLDRIEKAEEDIAERETEYARLKEISDKHSKATFDASGRLWDAKERHVEARRELVSLIAVDEDSDR